MLDFLLIPNSKYLLMYAIEINDQSTTSKTVDLEQTEYMTYVQG